MIGDWTRPAVAAALGAAVLVTGVVTADPGWDAEERPGVTDAAFTPDVFVRSYAPVGPAIETVRWPGEFVPPAPDEEGPGNLRLTELRWQRWDSDRAEALGTAVVEREDGRTDHIPGVWITLRDPERIGQVVQYTRYRLEWPGALEPDDYELDFTGSD